MVKVLGMAFGHAAAHETFADVVVVGTDCGAMVAVCGAECVQRGRFTAAAWAAERDDGGSARLLFTRYDIKDLLNASGGRHGALCSFSWRGESAVREIWYASDLSEATDAQARAIEEAYVRSSWCLL